MANRYYTIDADSHVEEPEEAWGFLEPPYSERPPLVVDKRGAPGLLIQDAFWLIDGHVFPRLKWAGVMPMHSVPDAIAELRRTHELGAVCAVTYGTVGETMLHEPQFDP